ncbi:MAG: hypothetical protein IPM97_00235 [Bdellovibrionaceae bacterium]|nr:hypothetical protein [Pseudobdellovibrionaceae bacterium]
MKSLFPVFVPSKGRFSPKTMRILPDATLVVEPHEAAEYLAMNSTAAMLVLPLSGQGVAYARQFILDHARKIGLKWYWIIDDDFHAFYRFENKKSIKIPAVDALAGAEKLFVDLPGVGQACLDNCQYAWAATRESTSFTRCAACVCVNVEATKEINYDLSFNMKEDIDFSIQVLNAGLNSMRLHSFGYSTATVGSTYGGLKPLYDDPSNDEKYSNEIVRKWGGGFCKVISKKTGRIDVRVNWKSIARMVQSPQRNFNQTSLGEV